MRLFIALDIPDAIRDRIARFLEGVSGFAPAARGANPESPHVTLKFIGKHPDSAVEQIKHALSTIESGAPEIHLRGYGFFPTAKSARVFWIGIEATPQLGALAAAIDNKMPGLGIPKEDRAFSPHLTLARRSGGSGSPPPARGRGRGPPPPRPRKRAAPPSGPSQRLQAKLAALPASEFGTMTP